MKRLLTLIFAFLLTCSISSVMLGQDAAATTDAATPRKVQTEHRKGAHSKARARVSSGLANRTSRWRRSCYWRSSPMRSENLPGKKRTQTMLAPDLPIASVVGALFCDPPRFTVFELP